MAYNYNVTNPTYSFARKANQSGGYNFFYNNKPVTQEFYSNVSGIPQNAALSGSYTPAPTGTANKAGSQNWAALIAAMNKGSTSDYVAPPSAFNYQWGTAMKAGTKSVTPYYQKQLALSMKQLNLQKEAQKTQYGQTIEDITKNLSQSLEDYGVNRTRTTEDVTTNLASLGAERKETMGAESRQAVRDREDALKELSAGTGIYGGMGKQQITGADVERRATAKAVTRKYTEATGQQETYLNRTLSDIAKGETRATGESETGKKRAKISLDDWIKSWGVTVEQTKRESEFNKQQAALKSAETIYQSQVRKYNLGMTPLQRSKYALSY